MKKRIKPADEPIGRLKIIRDFLPKPEDLVLRNDHIKVTLNLNRSSVAYFKQVAKSSHAPYQKVIRNLLDYYASHAG